MPGAKLLEVYPGPPPIVVCESHEPEVDYWSPVDRHLRVLLSSQPFSLHAFRSVLYDAIVNVVAYIGEMHSMHANACCAISDSRRHGRPFVLYLRNFLNSGRKYVYRGSDELTWDAWHSAANWKPERVQRFHGGDYTMIPMLQEFFGSIPVLYLSNTNMMHMPPRGKFSRTFGYRAHGKNWAQVVDALIPAAAAIVVLGEKHVKSVEAEMALVARHGRRSSTAVIVRREVTSRNTDAFGVDGDVVDFFDCVDRWQPATADPKFLEYHTRLTDAGRRYLAQKFSAESSPGRAARMPWLERAPCYIVGRDYEGDADSVDPMSDGFFIQEHQRSDLLSLTKKYREWQVADDRATVALQRSPKNRAEIESLASFAIDRALIVFALACRFENYEMMSDALAGVVARYVSVTDYMQEVRHIATVLFALEQVTRRRRNSDQVMAALDQLGL